ncbi:App1 family protein [Microbacterium sp. 179-B 1A2 NHS]|uniref:App1 family protein n=1 Tax=Microbacterium sp. 179-B 1A2 NHS TaxID=3142383 RepID=UPI0039A07CF0
MTSPPASDQATAEILWLARLEYRFHAWRAKRARGRGQRPTVAAFPGYGSTEWVRVLGRVLIPPKTKRRERGDYAGVRGWRSFASVPIAHADVTVTIAGTSHDVAADGGGVIDIVLPASLPAGWQTITMSVEGSDPVEARVFIVGRDVRFGVVSDIDDTVMVTALPRPLLAAWNSFVLNEHARQPVPGMAVLLERLIRDNPGSPILYLSTGAWNVAPTLVRFQRRHLFPSGAMLLTDWGPTHDRWFRSGKAHKAANLRRLADEFPGIRWLLVGDDGQHDDQIYTAFTAEHPEQVAAVAIRRLSPAEAVLAGGRTAVDDHTAAGVPWVTGDDGSELLERLTDVDVVRDVPPSS